MNGLNRMILKRYEKYQPMIPCLYFDLKLIMKVVLEITLGHTLTSLFWATFL